jgi:NADP-dependent 3-hydroxy acid dehydrogenase YdfG
MSAPSVPYRTALVTGASSGLGRGLAAWFARRGVRVYAAARRFDRLEALRAEEGERIVPVALDVRDAAATVACVETIDRECEGLDLVVANAGVAEDVPAGRLDWPLSQRTLLTNVVGAVATLSAALPGMVARGRGHLVGMSSMAAFRGLPRHAGYCASKAYLATWLESVRLDLQGTPIRVTSIHPGFVKSEMTARHKFRMLWLLETDDAVERMGRAIVRGKRVHRFPLPMSLLMRAARSIPDALYDRIVRALS